MSEQIIPNVVVSMPSQLFTLARKFQAASNGKIFIGKIDTDPTIPENQIQVYLENEDGTTVPVQQPLIINQAGYPVYNGQIAKFVTVQGHSMAVYDSYGSQQFYYPNVLKYDPDQLKLELSGNSGASMVGTDSGSTVQDELDVLNNKHIFEMPTYFKNVHSEPINGEDYPQGLAESDNYWFIIYTDRTTSPQKSHIKRIDKETGASIDSGDIQYGDLHNIAVLNDNEVIYVTPVSTGSYSYSGSLTKYNFTTGSTLAMTFESGTKMSTTYGFCYDGVDKLYQIDLVSQNINNPDGRFDQIRVYSISQMKRIGIIPMPREVVREGFVQALDCHQGMLYFYTGGSYIGNDPSNKRVTSIYLSSLNGQLLSGANYRADSFASAFQPDNTSVIGYEAQGISCRDGKVKILCFTGQSQANILIGSRTIDGDGIAITQNVNGSSYIREVRFSSFNELNISNSDLMQGDALGLIASRMLDNSVLECALDPANWSAITSQLGISVGVIRIYRANKSRVYGEVFTVNYDSTNASRRVSFSIYNGVTDAMTISNNYRYTPKIIYSDSALATVGQEINLNWDLYTSISVLVTNSSAPNPAGVLNIHSGIAKFCIENNQNLAVGNGVATVNLSITSSGIRVVGISGTQPIIRRVLAN
ncbi:phage head-binding domain-containing protein [Morganella morganii]|uniref:phage head-binding domain-containing protein n=1 Tax=Morganella morganii TaxID=582 RepID=UPI0033154EB2